MKGLWIFFLVSGLITFAVCIYAFLDARDFAAKAVKTTGVVVGFEQRGSTHRRKGRGSSPMYSAVVKYTTEDGLPVQFTNKRSRSTDPGYEVGQEVGVWYDPERVQKAIIYNSWWSLWWPMVVFPPLGLIFVGSAVFTKAVVRKGRYN